jgi:flagellar hook-length control protein FliK
MNQSSIDILLKMPVSRTETSPTARSRDEGSQFNDQFRLASDGGESVSPPAASTSLQRAPESSTSASRPAPAEDRKSTAGSTPHERVESDQREARETADAAAATQVAERDDEQQDDDQQDEEASQEEAAEVAALLATAEQARQPANKEVAQGNADHDAEGLKAESVVATERSADAPDRPEGKELGAKGNGPSAQAEVDAAAAQPTDTNVEESGRKANRQADVESDSTVEQTPATADGESPEVGTSSSANRTTDDTKSKPKRDDAPQEVAVAATNGEKQQSKAAAQVSQAPAVGSTKPADAEPKKADRKANARVATVSGDAATHPADRNAAAPRSSDAPATTTPIAANVQQQLATTGTTSVAAAESGVKPVDGANAAKPGLLSPFARLERGTHGTHRAAKGESANHVDPARFISRVARAIHTAEERNAPVQLRLSPPELGAMRVELTMNQGSLSATIETENATAQQLLLDNLPALRERLAEQNVKIERFDVDVRRDQTGSQQNFGTQDRGTSEQQDRGQGRHAAHRGPARTTAEDSQPIVRRTITNTSINVVA